MNEAIVRCARSWLGTRFHHQGRLKKTDHHPGGVDCLGLLVGIAAELNLTDSFGNPLAACDETDYPHQPDSAYLLKKLSSVVYPIPVECIIPGNIILLSIHNQPQHLAIISDASSGLNMIHAYAQARRVVEHSLDVVWRARITHAFRIL